MHWMLNFNLKKKSGNGLNQKKLYGGKSSKPFRPYLFWFSYLLHIVSGLGTHSFKGNVNHSNFVKGNISFMLKSSFKQSLQNRRWIPIAINWMDFSSEKQMNNHFIQTIWWNTPARNRQWISLATKYNGLHQSKTDDRWYRPCDTIQKQTIDHPSQNILWIRPTRNRWWMIPARRLCEKTEPPACGLCPPWENLQAR